jgi:hypothetical protein
MIDKRSSEPKLVEYNTISAGMGCMWNQVKMLQSYLQKKYEVLRPSTNLTNSEIAGKNHLMGHMHSEQLVKAFKTAIDLSRRPHEKALDLWVLFVIEDIETNVGD